MYQTIYKVMCTLTHSPHANYNWWQMPISYISFLMCGVREFGGIAFGVSIVSVVVVKAPVYTSI